MIGGILVKLIERLREGCADGTRTPRSSCKEIYESYAGYEYLLRELKYELGNT